MALTRWTFALALFLMGLGITAWLGTGRQSVTALIPTFLGLPILLAAFFARAERFRRPALVTAAVLALVGLAGTAPGFVKSVKLLAGAEVARPEAVVAQALVAIACLAWLLMGGLALLSRGSRRKLQAVRVEASERGS